MDSSGGDIAEIIEDLRAKQLRLYASLEDFNKEIVRRVVAGENFKLMRALYQPTSET